MDPRLKLRHLRCFLETARLGSLSAAAEFLHVSQPAASKTIKELEELLGATLFDRTGHRLTLTVQGKAFQQSAGAALIELERAMDLVHAPSRTQSRIAIGVLPTAATELVPRAAQLFHERVQNCILRVTTGPNWLLLSQLREGVLDMVVGRMPPSGNTEGLSFTQLYFEKVAPIVRAGHPLAIGDFSPKRLEDFPLMLPPSGAVISQSVRSYLHSVGVNDPQVLYENVSLAFGRAIVENSDTVWFISEGVVRPELRSGALVALPVENDLLGGPVGISTRLGVALEREKQILTEVIAGIAAQDHSLDTFQPAEKI